MNRIVRNLLKSLHPEQIPWPGSILYNAAARTPAGLPPSSCKASKRKIFLDFHEEHEAS